ncbi:MAG: DUF1211 domain-containing protein [Acetobacteraceae bacterium]|nr:DUF1211 domain-containing protein [Acetobacteraceae bacterium]
MALRTLRLRLPPGGILRSGEAETARVEAFSDGVLAIVITLLVLDVKVPQQVSGGNGALWHALGQQVPMLGAWALSFFFVLVFWVAHHYLFAQLAHVDRGLLWLNGLFLFAISFTPFPTALLGLYPGLSASAMLLSLAMFVTAGSFSLMRWYATRHAKLFRPEHAPHAAVALWRSLLGPALYLAAAVAAQIAIPVAVAIQIAVPLLFFLPAGKQAAEEEP